VSRAPEGATYFSNTAGVLMAMNRVGRQVWQLTLRNPVTSAVIIGWDGRVFIPAGSDFYCQTASGKPLWSKNLDSPISLAPALDHAGGLIMVLENRDFLRIDPFGGEERVRLENLPALMVPLKSASGKGENSYFLIYPDGETERILLDDQARAGSKLSRSRTASLPGPPAAAAGRDEQTAVTLRDGRVLLIPRPGAQARWTGNSHETVAEKGSGSVAVQNASMLFDERGIFVLTTRGATGFAVDGRRRWIIRFNETTAIPVFSDEGLIYACGGDRILRTYKVDNKPRTVSRSKYYGPDPEGTYGLGSPPPSPWASEVNRFDDNEQKAMLVRIDAAIKSGQIGENETAYVGYMMEMIGYFLNTPNASLVRPNVKPDQRVKLINLLGMVGSRETIHFLATVFNRDADQSIRAACAEAIGVIGVDPSGEAVTGFRFLLSRDNPHRAPGILMAATKAIAAMCRFSGPPLAAEGINLLNGFGLMDFPPDVKRQAQAELNALRREGLDRPLQQ
jgi:outer membrane protein assembly factor BamB